MSKRLVSLDAYRGFVMLAMVSEGLGFSHVARNFPHSSFWQFLSHEFSHASWTGCGAWDLIQPSFMFIVGVAMPYSYGARRARGDSSGRMWGHVVYRAIALILLGIFLRSNGYSFTRFTFEDVVTQIGLGYIFLYALLGRGVRVQSIALVVILVGYWLLFALWPTPGPGFSSMAAGIPPDWHRFTGFAAHWNKYMNPAGYFDQCFLNLFPWPKRWVYNGGGYQTLSFIPSLATMLFGLMTGEYLRREGELMPKVKRLALAGVACLAFGFAVDGNIWPFVDWHWSIAPVVKRIWTPSWAVYSTGWTLLTLSLFLWIIDLHDYRHWAFPFIVVGMNSVAMYVMS